GGRLGVLGPVRGARGKAENDDGARQRSLPHSSEHSSAPRGVELGLREGGPEVLVELTRLEPPVRQVRLLGRTSPAARPLGGVAGIGLVEVELAKQIVELRERRDETERTTQLAADGVAL